MMAMNNATDVVLDKVTINIGVGQAGDRLNKAARVVEILTKHKAVQPVSEKTVRDFNIRVGLPIGVKVTLRKKDAEEFLKRAFESRENKLSSYSFDKQGNAYFGVSDYTDFDGMKYDPEIGIFGMDIAVVLKRRMGYRIARRKINRKHIPAKLRITKEESIEFLKKKFKVSIVG